MCVDVTIVSPMTYPDFSADIVWKKRLKRRWINMQLDLEVLIDFNAFAMDIFGGMGKSCQTIVSRLAVG
jgi:hypothetical protein